MDYLSLLRPTLWCNAVFGLSCKSIRPDGVRASVFLRCYSLLLFLTDKSLQLCWFVEYLRAVTEGKALKDFQAIILLFCVVLNIAVSYFPLQSLLTRGGALYELIYRLHRFERSALNVSRRKLVAFFALNVAVIAVGFVTVTAYMTLEALQTWTSYSIGKHSIFIDATAIYGGFIRQCYDVVYFNGYLMFILVYGASYERMNYFLLLCRRSKTLSNGYLETEFLVRNLRTLREVDNTLSDFYKEMMKYYAWYCAVMMIITFLNWYYVVGFFFLSTSPGFVSYPSWVLFFMGMFFGLVGGSVFAKYQVDKTSTLLVETFIDNDDPKVLEEVEMFSLQLIHRNEEYYICGLFKLDFPLLLSMVGTVITYVIILKQFENASGRSTSGNVTTMNSVNVGHINPNSFYTGS